MEAQYYQYIAQLFKAFTEFHDMPVASLSCSAALSWQTSQQAHRADQQLTQCRFSLISTTASLISMDLVGSLNQYNYPVFNTIIP